MNKVAEQFLGFGIDHGNAADRFVGRIFSERVVLGELHAPEHTVIRIGCEQRGGGLQVHQRPLGGLRRQRYLVPNMRSPASPSP